MSGKKKGLGRGLSALLKDPDNNINSASDKNADKVVGNIIKLDIDDIEISPFQPRTNFNEETLRELGTLDLSVDVRWRFQASEGFFAFQDKQDEKGMLLHV